MNISMLKASVEYSLHQKTHINILHSMTHCMPLTTWRRARLCFFWLFDYINLGWRSTACLFKLLGLPPKKDACCATKQHGIPQVNRSHLGWKRDIHSGFALVESERLKQHSHTRVWWINIFRLIPYYIFGLRNMEVHGGSIWLSMSQSEVPTQFNFLSPWIAFISTPVPALPVVMRKRMVSRKENNNLCFSKRERQMFL